LAVLQERVVPRRLILDDIGALVFGKEGTFLVNRNDVYVGKAIEVYGEYGAFENVFLKSLLKQGDNVIEVGANIGAHTISLAKAVGPNGKIFAFEPQRACFALLQAQIALNKVHNVYAYNCAVGRAPGQLWVPHMNYAELNNFGGVQMLNENVSGAEAVDVVTLDEKFADMSCALIKIDAEGMEEDVLRGGASLIKKLHPLLYIENDRAEKSRSLVSFLLELDYRLWWHISRLYNPNNFFGVQENLYGALGSYNMFCCQGSHEAAAGLVEIKSPNEPHPLPPRK
jgi:FkbM family methyltransferase